MQRHIRLRKNSKRKLSKILYPKLKFMKTISRIRDMKDKLSKVLSTKQKFLKIWDLMSSRVPLMVLKLVLRVVLALVPHKESKFVPQLVPHMVPISNKEV